jgi:GxxExxY protein
VLRNYGLDVQKQHPVAVCFRNEIIGDFRADVVVEEKIILELKSVSKIMPEHEAQLINYLKATNIDIGLLMNFGNKPEFKRFAFDQKRSIRKDPR